MLTWIEVRVRLFFELLLVQTSQWQPIIGTPCDVPVPMNTIFIHRRRHGKSDFGTSQNFLEYDEGRQETDKTHLLADLARMERNSFVALQIHESRPSKMPDQLVCRRFRLYPGLVSAFIRGCRCVKDIAIGFPPLNQVLARRLMENTLIYTFAVTSEVSLNIPLLEKLLVKF